MKNIPPHRPLTGGRRSSSPGFFCSHSPSKCPVGLSSRSVELEVLRHGDDRGHDCPVVLALRNIGNERAVIFFRDVFDDDVRPHQFSRDVDGNLHDAQLDASPVRMQPTRFKAVRQVAGSLVKQLFCFLPLFFWNVQADLGNMPMDIVLRHRARRWACCKNFPRSRLRSVSAHR